MEIVLSFPFAFLDEVPRIEKDEELMNVNSLDFEIFVEIYGRHYNGRGNYNESKLSVRKLVNELTERTVFVVRACCETAPFKTTLKTF